MFYFNQYTVIFAIIAVAGIAALVAISRGTSSASRLANGSLRATSPLYWSVGCMLGMIVMRSFVNTSKGWPVHIVMSLVFAGLFWLIASSTLKAHSVAWGVAPGLVFAVLLAGALLGWLVRDTTWWLALIVGLVALVAVIASPALPGAAKRAQE